MPAIRSAIQTAIRPAIMQALDPLWPRSGGEDNPNAATIRADGWTVLVTIPDAVVGGTYDLGTDAEPAVSMTVTSKSWSVDGVETTLDRTVYGKAVLRKPYPDQLVKDEVVNGTGIDVPVVLNDYIYADETISNVTVAAGFHTDSGDGGSGLPSTVQTATPTNSSSFPYRKPIAMWLNHDLDWVKANTYNVQMAVAHKDFQNGLPVRAVKFIATDTHSHNTSVVASTMVKRDFAITGLSAPVFSGDLDFSGLTQGDMVTIDAIIYPWIGDAFQVSVDGDAYPSPNLTVIKVLNDRTGAYGTVYAYVDGVGGGTPACHTNPVTARATPYATVSLAAAGLQAYIYSTFGRNNISGGIVRLEVGTHVHGSFSARAVGEIPLIIEAADIADKATTIYQDAGVSTWGSIPKKLKIRNIVLKKTANVGCFESSPNSASIFVVENITFEGIAENAYYWIEGVGEFIMIDCDGTDWKQCNGAANVMKHTKLIGCNGFMGGTVYSAIGSKTLNGSYNACQNATPGNAYYPLAKGAMLGWCFIGQPENATYNILIDKAEIDERGLAIVGNVIEQSGGMSGPCVSVQDEATSLATQNYIEVGNTFVGSRTNELYQGYDAEYQHHSGISSLNVCYAWNSKSDVFAQNPLCTGNWEIIYRVGSKCRCIFGGDNGAVGVGAWAGEVLAVGDVSPANTPIITDWLNDQSFTVGGAGNGDYTPGPLTELPQIPAGQTAYPYDLLGRAIPTDGTAFVGAVQKEAV